MIPANPRAWGNLPIFFNFYFHCFQVFSVAVFHFLFRFSPTNFELNTNRVPLSRQVCYWHMIMLGFCILILCCIMYVSVVVFWWSPQVFKA